MDRPQHLKTRGGIWFNRINVTTLCAAVIGCVRLPLPVLCHSSATVAACLRQARHSQRVCPPVQVLAAATQLETLQVVDVKSVTDYKQLLKV